jgi:hypothetical protein
MLNFHIRWNRTHADYGIIPFVHEQLLSVFRSGEVDVAVQSLTSHIENGEFNLIAIAEWNSGGTK